MGTGSVSVIGLEVDAQRAVGWNHRIADCHCPHLGYVGLARKRILQGAGSAITTDILAVGTRIFCRRSVFQLQIFCPQIESKNLGAVEIHKQGVGFEIACTRVDAGRNAEGVGI